LSGLLEYAKVIATEPIKKGDLLLVWVGEEPFVLYARPWGSYWTWMANVAALDDCQTGGVVDVYERQPQLDGKGRHRLERILRRELKA
jgi:hypothetical protein